MSVEVFVVSSFKLLEPGLIDPIDGLVDYTKNWQKRVLVFGMEASRPRRNQLLLSAFVYFAWLSWEFLKDASWFTDLQVHLSVAGNSCHLEVDETPSNGGSILVQNAVP